MVESEKTAIIASVYFPGFVWLATGGLSNLKADNCAVLRGRNVVLFPDLNAFDKWSAKAETLSRFANVAVSDLLEKNAPDIDRHNGYDLADYLVQFSLEEFCTSKNDKIS